MGSMKPQAQSDSTEGEHDARMQLDPLGTVVGEAAERVEREAVSESVVIPGDREEIAEETAEVSPERRPGDPKAGPNALRLEVLVGLLIMLCFAVALGWWVNVFAGILAAVIGTLAVSINPVVGATSQRANEREAVAEHHKVEDPDMVVIRTTSKRKERREVRSM